MGRWYSDSDYHSSSETSDSGLRDEYDDQRWDPDKFRALERVNIELEEMYEAERVAEDGTSLYTDPASTEEAGPPAPSQPRPEADAGKPADEAESGARAADTLPDLDLEQLLLPAGMEVVPDTTVDTGRELKKLMRQPRCSGSAGGSWDGPVQPHALAIAPLAPTHPRDLYPSSQPALTCFGRA